MTARRKGETGGKRARQAPIAAFPTAPGFAVVGDGNWIPPENALVCFVLLSSPLDDRARSAFLRGVPRLLRHALAWSGPLLRLGTHLEQSYLSERKAATLVRKQYRPAKQTKLSAKAARELGGDDYDPKVLPAAREAMADFGDAAPWARFYDDLHGWLLAAHERAPIRLFIRKTVAGPLTELHRAGVEACFGLELTELANAVDRDPWVRTFLQEVALHASRAELDERRARSLVPILAHAFGIDAYGEAGLRLLAALPTGDRTRFLDGIAPAAALAVQLRADYLPTLASMPGFAATLASTFERFWRSPPDAEAIDGAAFRIQYAIFPALAIEGLFGQLVDEIARHRDRYPLARFGELPDSLARRGSADAADRLRRALTG